jgi:Xaa-Pro aminopeptidase
MVSVFLALVVAAQIPAQFAARRVAAMGKVSDGLLLVRSSSALDWDSWSFRQDPSFFYLTGLPNAQRTTLVLEGPTKQAWLFVAAAPESTPFVPHLNGQGASFLPATEDTARMLRMEHVLPLEQLDRFLSERRTVLLYLDVGSTIGSLPASEEAHVAETNAVRERWPGIRIENGTRVLQAIRAVKSLDEIALLEKAARITAAAFDAGVGAIRPGVRQREVEAAVARACVHGGGEGPSFWPWVRGGAQAGPANLYESMADYHNRDQPLAASDLVRFDIGCEYEHYKADYGRTIPVSGRFDEGQREALDLLNGAYHAGLSVMRPGATPAEVNRATTAYVMEHRGALKTPFARDAAAVVNEKTGWFLHGIGLELLEDPPRVFEPGNVICFEPRLTAHDQSVFVEDTFLIASDGYRQLSPRLPTSPGEIENDIARLRRK